MAFHAGGFSTWTPGTAQALAPVSPWNYTAPASSIFTGQANPSTTRLALQDISNIPATNQNLAGIRYREHGKAAYAKPEIPAHLRKFNLLDLWFVQPPASISTTTWLWQLCMGRDHAGHVPVFSCYSDAAACLEEILAALGSLQVDGSSLNVHESTCSTTQELERFLAGVLSNRAIVVPMRPSDVSLFWRTNKGWAEATPTGWRQATKDSLAIKLHGAAKCYAIPTEQISLLTSKELVPGIMQAPAANHLHGLREAAASSHLRPSSLHAAFPVVTGNTGAASTSANCAVGAPSASCIHVPATTATPAVHKNLRRRFSEVATPGFASIPDEDEAEYEDEDDSDYSMGDSDPDLSDYTLDMFSDDSSECFSGGESEDGSSDANASGEHDGNHQDSGNNQPAPLPVAKPVAEKQPLIGDGTRWPSFVGQDEQHHTSRFPDLVHGRVLGRLPVPGDRLDGQGRRSGPRAGKLEQVPELLGNSEPAPRTRRSTNNSVGEDWASTTFTPHPQAKAPKEIRSEMVQQRQAGVTASASSLTSWKKWLWRAKVLLTILAAVYAMAVAADKLLELDDHLEAMMKLVTFKKPDVADDAAEECFAPAEAVEEALASCFEGGVLDMRLPYVSCRISHETTGSVKWWRNFHGNLFSKHLVTPLAWSRRFMGKMPFELIMKLKQHARVLNREDGTCINLMPFSLASYTAQKAADVHKASQLGYEWVRSQGHYGYVVKSVESVVALMVMAGLRSEAAVAEAAITDPAQLPAAARAAGATCGFCGTLVASLDASVFTRAYGKVTSVCISLGGRLYHGMYPIAISTGGDGQEEITRSCGTAATPGGISLFKQLEQLKAFAVELPAKYFHHQTLWIDLSLALVVDQPAMAAMMGLAAVGVSAASDRFTAWTAELRSEMRTIFAVVDVDTGDVYDPVNGIYHTKHRHGCDCRGCRFKADSASGKRGAHHVPDGPLTILQLRQAFSMSHDLFYELNGILADFSECKLLSELPEDYRCAATVDSRVAAGKYAAGSVLDQMQKMMIRSKGRYVVVVRKPMYGYGKDQMSSCLLLGDALITIMYPAVMHMFKSIGKRFFKLIVRHATDADSRDGGNRVQRLQDVCRAAGRPFSFTKEKSKYGAYQKIRMNEDFVPLWGLLAQHGMQLIDIAFSDTASQSTGCPEPEEDVADEEHDPVPGLCFATVPGSSTSASARPATSTEQPSAGATSQVDWVKRHLRQLLQLCQMIKKDGCYTEEAKIQAAELATTVLVSYLRAGFSRRQLSNYYLLLSFMSEWQPPKCVNFLITGQFLLCPESWDPWRRPAECLKDVSDENIELHHRITKHLNTNQGGGRWQQHESTVSSDTVQRDILGLHQICQSFSVKLLESLEQLCPLPRVPRRMFKNIMVEWGTGMASVEQVLQELYDQGLRYKRERDGGYTGQHLNQLCDASKATNLTWADIISWLSRKEYPGEAAGRRKGASVLPPKLVDDEPISLSGTDALASARSTRPTKRRRVGAGGSSNPRTAARRAGGQQRRRTTVRRSAAAVEAVDAMAVDDMADAVASLQQSTADVGLHGMELDCEL